MRRLVYQHPVILDFFGYRSFLTLTLHVSLMVTEASVAVNLYS